MKANQTLIASDGYEVALFPMPYLYMTQDEGGSYSHYNTYNIDLIGYDGRRVITRAPLYAPCTMKVVNYMPSYSGGHGVTFESTKKVHLPNGKLDYLTILFMHDNNPPYTKVGTIVSQGQLCYRTGTYGYVTGDHVHTCVGQGHWQGLIQRSGGNWDLANRIHYWSGVYVNDTKIIVGYGHNWQKYNGGSPSPTPTPTPSGSTSKRDKFPWAIARAHWPNFKR